MSEVLRRLLEEGALHSDEPHSPASAGHGGEDGAEPEVVEIVGGESGIADVVFVVASMLLIGIVTRSLLQRVPVPYTVWLLIWGLVAGGTAVHASQNHKGWHPVNEGLQIISDINPNGLLLIFMPILIYGSAQSMDWHILKVELAQILIMATSGVVVAMCLTAVCIYYIFPFGWSWFQCFMFGALISATDPVAVVALLKEVGASARLGTIIEGESLLNDGSAFVLFLIFKEYVLFDSCCKSTDFQPYMIEGCSNYEGRMSEGTCNAFSPGDAVVLFVKLSFGGPASGLMFGLLMCLWLMYTYNDEIVEIFITITGAYITFYISEDIFGVSGVLSIVTLGFFMAAVGRSYVSPRVLHPMETVWEILEFGANTVIFVLAGVIISEEIYPILNDDSVDSSAPFEWAGYGVLLYIICQAVRFATIFLHYPILSFLGYGLTWQQAIIISWSGLRGAIGLALALLVNLDTALDRNFRYQVLLFTSIVVILTLVINGSLTRTLLIKLGILAAQPVKVEFLIHSIHEMEDYAEKHCSYLKTDLLIGDPDWDRVIELAHIDTSRLVDPEALNSAKSAMPMMIEKSTIVEDSDKEEEKAVDSMEAGQPLQEVQESTSNNTTPLRNKTAACTLTTRNLKKADVIRDVRARLLHGVKATYGEGFYKNYISPDQLLELQSSVSTSLDHLDRALHDWDLLEPENGVSKLLVNASSTGTNMHCFDTLFQKLLFQELEHAIVVANSYIYAHSSTRQRLASTLEDTDIDSLDQETYEITKLAIELVIKESKEQSRKAAQQIKALKTAYPEVTRAVKTKLVALSVIHKKEKFVEQLKQAAIIEDKDYEILTRSLLIRSYYVKHNTYKGITLPEPKDLLKSCILFDSLTSEEFESNVVPNAKHLLIASHDKVFQKGDNALKFYVIIRGSTSSEATADKEKCLLEHQGSAIGVTEMLLGIPRIRNVTAISICEAYEFQAETFAQLMVDFPMLEHRAWQMCGATLAFHYDEPVVAKYTVEEIRSYFHNADVVIASSGEDVHVIGHTYLIHGSLQSHLGPRAINQNPVKYESPRMLGPAFMHLSVSSSFAVLLVLPSNYSRTVNASLIDTDIMMRSGSRDVDAKELVHQSLQPGIRQTLSMNMVRLQQSSDNTGADRHLERNSKILRESSMEQKEFEQKMGKGTGKILNRMSSSYITDHASNVSRDSKNMGPKPVMVEGLEHVMELQRSSREARSSELMNRLNPSSPTRGISPKPFDGSARSFSGPTATSIPEHK